MKIRAKQIILYCLYTSTFEFLTRLRRSKELSDAEAPKKLRYGKEKLKWASKNAENMSYFYEGSQFATMKIAIETFDECAENRIIFYQQMDMVKAIAGKDAKNSKKEPRTLIDIMAKLASEDLPVKEGQ